MAHKAFTITEASDHERGVVVDRDKGIIRDVKILGLVSENNRRYLPEAVKSAKHLYEGIKVNINHPDSSNDQRSAEDRFGKLINVYFVEGEGLYGDLMFLKSHPMAERVCEAAERMTDVFGLSHNAQGDGVDDKDGCFVINEIVSVRHVDLVSDPATTKSLSEAVNMEKKSIKEAGKDSEKLNLIKEAVSSLDEADDILSRIAQSGSKIGPQAKRKVDNAISKIRDVERLVASLANQNLAEAIKTRESDMPYDKEMPEEMDKMPKEEDVAEADIYREKLEQVKEVVNAIEEADDILSRMAQSGAKLGPKAKRKVDMAIAKLREVDRLVSSMGHDDLSEADDIFDEEPAMSDEDPSEEVEPDMEEEELDKKAPMESKRIIKLCHANGIKPTKGLLEDFNGLSLASIKRHIGRLKLAKLSRAPRSSAPASSEISESKIPTDVFSWLRS